MNIDLNCDMGEREGAGGLAADAELLAWVSSANIACGGHAGDEATMRGVVEAAAALGRGLGAHPGYPDRANFGRVVVPISPADLRAEVAEQIGRLAAVAGRAGARVAHVKPHGALYHQCSIDPGAAEAVRLAASDAAPGAVLVGQSGSAACRWWRAAGAIVVEEGFADRAYEPDGSLRARSLPGASITDAGPAAAQALRLARGEGLPTRVGTICVHSDTPGAAEVARAVRRALEGAGFTITPLAG
jgi:5-oxoprolinase (ATP-hydrolysing) subunit A